MKQDNRADMKVKTTLMIVITLSIIAIVGAFLLPVAVDEIEGNTTFSTTQDTQSPNETVNAVLDANLTAVDTAASPSTATIELNNNGTTESNTINNGTITTYSTLPDGDVDVGVTDVNSGNASFNVTYANDYAYGDAASSVWGLVGFIIILAFLLYLLSYGLGTMN